MPHVRERAPGKLGLIEDFVNTRTFLFGREQLGSPGALRDWLLEQGQIAPDAEASEVAWRRALAAREGIRALLRANNGVPLTTAAIGALNDVLAALHLEVRLDEGGDPAYMPRADGVDGAVGEILALALAARADRSLDRLKACHDDACQWAFYDRSRNHSATWCVMEDCGNRNKTRTYRERRRAAHVYAMPDDNRTAE